ncbi:MAG: PHP domain-containing protein [Armatimonadota bacterium]
MRPDPREYYVDFTLCPTYNFDLDNVDSIPECLPFLLVSPWLIQRDLENPLSRALTETELLNTDEGRLERRILDLGIYLGANWGAADNAANAILFMLKRERIGVRDPWVSIGARFLSERFSGFVGTAQATGNEIAIDIGVHAIASYDSVANVENMILSAHRSGLRAIVITDHDTIGGALYAQRVAERLKREGRIRKDFMVIVGEEVTTREGHIYALFIHEHVLQGMTARQTIREIHRQGGLAILTDPAASNGIHMATKYPFDGFVISPGMRRYYRSSQLLADEKLWGKSFFFAISPHFKDTFAAVYTLVDTPDHTPEGLKRAIREGSASAAGNAYYPYIAILGMVPIMKFERFVNRYFEGRAELERLLERILGADHVRLRLTWTPEIHRLMNLQVFSTMGRLAVGDSPLRDPPKVDGISLSYGPVYIDSTHSSEERVFLSVASRF